VHLLAYAGRTPPLDLITLKSLSIDMRGSVAECRDQIVEEWTRRNEPFSACSGCPLKAPTNGPVVGVGNTREPIVMAIGFSPNETPQKRKKTFEEVDGFLNVYWKKAENSSDPGWKKMSNAFGEIFSILEDGKYSVYFTNVWKCTNLKRPEETTIDALLTSCGKHLEKEIQTVAPRIAVTFGEAALKGLHSVISNRYNLAVDELGKGLREAPTFHDIEGKPIPVSELNLKVLPAFHWSFGETNSRNAGKREYRERIRDVLEQALE